MKLIMILIVFFLYGCQSSDIRLPNLEGQSGLEIEAIFNRLDVDYQLIERSFVIEETSNEFIEYGQFLSPGDVVEPGSFVPIIVSARLIDSSIYYVPQNMIYDGPRLDDSFFDMPLAVSQNGTIRGSGGAFFAELNTNGCIDGDTARFLLPSEMIEFTNNQVMSTRFFNFDSPETFRGGEEEFGFTASRYACELLENTSQIVLQTDPGDNLFDRFGRLLAWIWIENDNQEFELLNYWMVRQGLGEVKYLFGAGETSTTVYDGLTYTQWMFLAEERAQDEELGIFGNLRDFYWDYDLSRPVPGARP
jgi:micrococcal nuclease